MTRAMIKSILLSGLLSLIIFPVRANAGGEQHHFRLNWSNPQKIMLPDSSFVQRLNFDDAVYENGNQPVFQRKIRLDNPAASVSADISNTVFQPLTQNELLLMDDLTGIGEQITVQAHAARARGVSYAIVGLSPFRFNPETGKYERLLSFDLQINSAQDYKSGNELSDFGSQSVLNSGTWYKIRVSETGLYKVTYAQMAEMGIAVNGLSSNNIRLYGNGGGMLPEANDAARPDDLQERAIQVFDGGDNTFNEGDYFIFYATGPDVWEYLPMDFRFSHRKNVYDDYAYYFINTDLGPGKRVTTLAPSGETPNYTSTTFNDYAFHELDQQNLIGTGREWYGELFDLQTSYDFSFNFPNLSSSATQFFKTRVAAKSVLSSSYLVTLPDSTFTVIVAGTPENLEGEFAKVVTGEKRFKASSETININLRYNKSTNSAQGWLDYIELNVVRNSVFTGGQMAFRDVSAKGSTKITEFNLSNVNSNVTVWEVSDPFNIKKVQTTLSGNTLKFVLPTPTVREFVAWDGNDFLTPEFVEEVANQNLHGAQGIDYVIVSHPDFLDQAYRLAQFHADHSGMNTLVVTPQQVYNEFSSGAQDITAIKDLMRMLYHRSNSGYLLLFGDASYDYKDRMENNTNFVPTFESPNSLHYTYSYATDDYFGFLDPEEGTSSTDLLDIGIGRFVVATPEEAQMAVDKVIYYATNPQSMGDWQNVITFVADDEDGNSHLNQAEQLAEFIDTTYKQYNVDKIYVDSYIQKSTPGGSRYPAVNEAIDSRMEKGTMIMNYTGHGGEVGWGHERFLENSDINGWTNYDRMSVFITATCEFARYDDPERTSAGELVFLNPNGGGVALFTTARATFGGSNLSLNKGIYTYAFEKKDNSYYHMGDLIRLAKLQSSSSTNDKKFVLLGDPALKMAYPSYQVKTTGINNQQINDTPDTLSALSNVVISGEITDGNGNRVNGFNGTLTATVFDKDSKVTTLGQDPSSAPRTFMLRKNVIYKGKAQVTDGTFSFSFIVPIDIGYQFGFGKISYYAENGEKSASGYYQNIVVGGYNNTATVDNNGPKIKLYMNDTTFKSGDITNQNPVLLAHITDESGINTVGNGIGHDIVAILDEDTENPHNLNEFYASDFGGYKSGSVQFPFFDIAPGIHTVNFKVWDVFNNSSEASLTFRVVGQDQVVIDQLINYPNPFSDYTYFRFNHNQAKSKLDVDIKIYDFSGRMVAELQHNNVSQGFFSDPIRWDGESSGGMRLKGGFYIYRVQITDEDGHTSSAVKKLIISR